MMLFFCSGSAGFDTASTAYSAPVAVQPDTTMMQSPVEPRSVSESDSINQTGGGSGDRGRTESNAHEWLDVCS